MIGPHAILGGNRSTSRIALILVSTFLTFWVLQASLSRGSNYYLLNGFPTTASTANSLEPDPSLLGKVWQIFLDPVDHDPTILHNDATKASNIPFDLVGSWLPVDGGWDYHFLGTDRADPFVRDHFKNYPDIVKVFTELTRPVIRGDIMRYLAVCAEGGVFSDYDTHLKKPLQQWIPEEYLNQTRAVIGVEFDRLDGPPGNKRRFGVSFVQYAFAATPWHPIMLKMAQNATTTILERAKTSGKPISELKFDDDDDILDLTGPVAFTQIVYDHLSAQAGREIVWQDVSKLQKPKLIGDTLILTINGFGAGQAHSGANDSSPDVLLRHMFHGGWRGGKDTISGHT